MITPVVRAIRKGYLGLAISFSALLAGCAVAPSVELPLLPSPQAALKSREAYLALHSALTETPVPSQWWSLFDDPTLVVLEEEASAANLDLQAAATRVDESRARLGFASAARQPQLAANAGYSRAANSEKSPIVQLGAPTTPFDTWAMGVQASWELDLWGHLRQVRNAAQANLEAAGFGREAVQVSVAAEVARTYLLLRGVQSKLSVLEQNWQIAADLVRMAESRRRNGVASRFDEASARAELAAIDGRLTQQRQDSDALKNALALLLGKPPRELDEQLANAPLPAMPQQLPVGVPSEVARQRPDILQAEANLRAAVSDMGAAQADFYPRISLSGGLGVQAFDLSELGSWGSRQFSVGPTLYLPIFDGGRLKSQMALTEARHRSAALAYQQKVLQAWHEVDDALGAYAGQLKRHEQLQQAAGQSQTALDVARRAYQQGAADFTTVLVANRSLLSSQAELNDCATASALSVVALYRALGGGWLQPEPKVAGASL